MSKSGPIDGVGLTASIIGSALVYSGIKGYSLLAVIQNLVTGKPIAENVTVTSPLSTPGTAVIEPEGTSGMGSNPALLTGSPRAIGKTMAAEMGWTGAEWDALEKLWTRESNWNPKARNPSSGAYGIPQSLPHTKMPKAAWPEFAGGSSSAVAQIRWGLNYIKQRYGSPRMAWAFWQRQSPHWY